MMFLKKPSIAVLTIFGSLCCVANAFTFDESFIAMSRWAGAHGFSGGLLNWEQAPWFGSYARMGSVAFRDSVATTADVPASEVDGWVDFGDKMRRISRYIGSQPGYVAGYPNSELGAGVYGACWLKEGAAFVVDARDVDLDPWTDDISRFRSFSRWVGNQYPGAHGYPNYEQAAYGNGGTVFGVVVIPAEHFQYQEIPQPSLSFSLKSGWKNMDYPHFWAVLRQHHIAVTSIPACTYISQDEKERLADTYATANIVHTTSSKCNGWACGGTVGYCCNLLTVDEQELGRTAIHEMMHVAGYKHDEPKPSGVVSSCDAPAHSFFSWPPLRAECCMPGTLQADLADDDYEDGGDGLGLIGGCPDSANTCPAPSPSGGGSPPSLPPNGSPSGGSPTDTSDGGTETGVDVVGILAVAVGTLWCICCK